MLNKQHINFFRMKLNKIKNIRKHFYVAFILIVLQRETEKLWIAAKMWAHSCETNLILVPPVQ